MLSRMTREVRMSKLYPLLGIIVLRLRTNLWKVLWATREFPSKTHPAKCPPLASKTILKQLLSLGSWSMYFSFSITSFWDKFITPAASMISDLSVSNELFSDSLSNKHLQTETLSPLCSCINIFLFEIPPNSHCLSARRLVRLSSSSSDPEILDTS